MVKPIDVDAVVAEDKSLQPLSNVIPVFPKFNAPGFSQNGRPLKIWIILSTISFDVASLLASTITFLSTLKQRYHAKMEEIVVVLWLKIPFE